MPTWPKEVVIKKTGRIKKLKKRINNVFLNQTDKKKGWKISLKFLIQITVDIQFYNPDIGITMI